MLSLEQEFFTTKKQKKTVRWSKYDDDLDEEELNIIKRVNDFQFETTRTPYNTNNKIVVSVLNNSTGFRMTDLCQLWQMVK